MVRAVTVYENKPPREIIARSSLFFRFKHEVLFLLRNDVVYKSLFDLCNDILSHLDQVVSG